MSDKRRQFLRFVMNGCAAVAVQYAVYLALLPAVSPYWANAAGYVVSFCLNYIVTSYWTFSSRPTRRHALGFAASHCVNFLCQQAFLWVALMLVPERAAAIIAMACAVPVNFALLRLVYKSSK